MAPRRARPSAYALLLAGVALLTIGCDSRVYVRDGVTDGTRFSVLPHQLDDPSPVTQSWIAYSLALSACQLRRGSANPARDSAFECELAARDALLESWRAYRADGAAGDAYLDTLSDVRDAGCLREYVWHYLRRRHWSRPTGLALESFAAWRQLVLADHRPRTRLIGAWTLAPAGVGSSAHDMTARQIRA